jgi:hypothetical protein
VVLFEINDSQGGHATMNSHNPDNNELAPGALVDCPTCGLPAEITDRFTLGGAPGPIEHVKVVCVRRHWYTLPVDTIPVNPPVPEHTHTAGVTRQR